VCVYKFTHKIKTLWAARIIHSKTLYKKPGRIANWNIASRLKIKEYKTKQFSIAIDMSAVQGRDTILHKCVVFLDNYYDNFVAPSWVCLNLAIFRSHTAHSLLTPLLLESHQRQLSDTPYCSWCNSVEYYLCIYYYVIYLPDNKPYQACL
jgi:hypothetical protein